MRLYCHDGVFARDITIKEEEYARSLVANGIVNGQIDVNHIVSSRLIHIERIARAVDHLSVSDDHPCGRRIGPEGHIAARERGKRISVKIVGNARIIVL